ncbi:ABC transporter substrate-binding protein [Alkalihalobacterium elongatum]|uniref:ABC transporter substrate-binding protein n=1 Tax=Alkalihalobacterium elongatum TaxID=2675466 RepID=UPI001C1FC4CE|nr:ABC transporter substrate-binding protein [Alkalihalobacterium elongatum]
MVKGKKQFFYIIVISMLAMIALIGCSNEETGTNNSEGGTSEQTDKGDSVELAQGVTDSEILVGHLGPQTGPVAIYDYIRKGIESHFNYVNENGGVHGRQLKLVAYDDQYQPAKTVQLASRLVEEDKVFATLGNVCTPCNTAARNTYESAGIPMVMVSTGAQEFVNPPIKNYFGSSILNYRVEARVFLDYAVNKLNSKKIAIVYQNDDYGKEGLTALQENVGSYDGVEIVAEIPYVAGDTDFSTQSQHLSQASPDVVIAMATPNPAASLRKDMDRIGLGDIPYIVSSVGANDRNLFSLAGEGIWEGTISAATFPMPGLTDDPSMKLYEERFSKDFPNDPIDGFGPVGWAIGEVFVEALERTGGELTWGKFFESLYSFDNYTDSIYEGVTFTEENHYGLTTMILTEAKDGQIVPVSGAITFDPATGEITYED